MTTFMPLAYFRHFYRVFYHKYFVFIAGRRLQVPLWRLIKHDWSKFSPTEWHGYALQFFTPYKGTEAWKKAWEHHWSHNDHHPEYWANTLITTGPTSEILASMNGPAPMTIPATREMVADWLAASRAYNGAWPVNFETWEWWHKAGHKLPLAFSTRQRVETLLNEYFRVHGCPAHTSVAAE